MAGASGPALIIMIIKMVANQSFQHIWWVTLNFTPDLRGAYHYYYYYYVCVRVCAPANSIELADAVV